MGSSCSIPRPGRASSSYLLEAAGCAILADLGTGAFANLLRHCAADTLDAVVISHMHADHFIDVIPLRYALKYGERTNDRRVPLYLPPGGEEVLRAVVAPFSGEAGAFLDDVFAVANYDPEAGLDIGGVAIGFAPTRHYIACYAMRFALGRKSLVYSADTAPHDGIARFARDVDAFVCEATLAPQEEALEPRGHLSAREAGTLATKARARSLVLTHYPASARPDEMARSAATTYAGQIRVVDDGERFEL